MLGTLETDFHGQKTYRLVGGSLSWSETPYFHIFNGAKIDPERPNVRKKLVFQTYISRELSD